MRKVIDNERYNYEVVMLANINELKTYCMYTINGVYILKKCNPVGLSGRKWAWMSVFTSDIIGGEIFDNFTEAIQEALQSYDVFEINNIQELIDFLSHKK